MDVGVALGGESEWECGADAVVVASADALAFEVAGLAEVGDDRLGSAFGDPEEVGEVADADLWVLGDDEECFAVVCEKGEAGGLGAALVLGCW